MFLFLVYAEMCVLKFNTYNIDCIKSSFKKLRGIKSTRADRKLLRWKVGQIDVIMKQHLFITNIEEICKILHTLLVNFYCPCMNVFVCI